jgi:hypothetical protein
VCPFVLFHLPVHVLLGFSVPFCSFSFAWTNKMKGQVEANEKEQKGTLKPRTSTGK